MYQEQEQPQQQQAIIKKPSRFSNNVTIFSNISRLPEDLVPVIYEFIPLKTLLFLNKKMYFS